MKSARVPADLWAARWATLQSAWVEFRYHKRRQRFYDQADRVALIALLVMVAALAVLGPTVKAVAGGEWIIALMGGTAAMLVPSMSAGRRARIHEELAEMAAELVASIVACPASEITPAKASAWNAAYVRLCGKAPPALRTLTLICEREQSTVEGHPEHVPLQPFVRRLLAHLWS